MVGNRACLEGSITKRYIVNECTIFLSMYRKDDETTCNQLGRNYDGSQNQQREGLSVFSLMAYSFRHIKSKPEIFQKEIGYGSMVYLK